MATLYEILCSIAGEEIDEWGLWRLAKDRTTTEILEEVLAVYHDATLEPMESKSAARLRPAFLADYAGRSRSPYDREFNFVARSALYSDAVVVRDELYELVDGAHATERRDDLTLGHTSGVSDALWALRRIIRYAPLETSGILRYAPMPDSYHAGQPPADVPAEMVRDLRNVVIDRCDFHSEVPDSAIKEQLNVWARQFHTVVDYCATYRDYVDLYLPQWFCGPELMEWFCREDAPAWLGLEQLRQQRVLTQLVDMPAPIGSIFDTGAAAHLPAIREDDQMAGWREEVTAMLETLPDDPGLLEREELRREFAARANARKRSIRERNSLREFATDVIGQGLSVGPAALATGQEPLGAVATSVASLLPDLVRPLAAWLTRPNPSAEEIVLDPTAQATGLRAYFAELPATENDGQQSPPTSWMVSRGRLMAFDLFPSWDAS